MVEVFDKNDILTSPTPFQQLTFFETLDQINKET